MPYRPSTYDHHVAAYGRIPPSKSTHKDLLVQGYDLATISLVKTLPQPLQPRR